MSDIEVRVQEGKWTTLSREDARELFVRSRDFINHYDLIVTASHRFDILDLSIAAFLEAIPRYGMMLKGVHGADGKLVIEDTLAEMTSALQQIPSGVDVWDWPDTDENRTALRNLFRACQLKSFGPAVITKMLHLKRPRLIPPIDSRLRRAWNHPVPTAWTYDELIDITFEIGSSLREREATVAELRSLGLELGWPYHALTPLRLYDILSWWLTGEENDEETSPGPLIADRKAEVT